MGELVVRRPTAEGAAGSRQRVVEAATVAAAQPEGPGPRALPLESDAVAGAAAAASPLWHVYVLCEPGGGAEAETAETGLAEQGNPRSLALLLARHVDAVAPRAMPEALPRCGAASALPLPAAALPTPSLLAELAAAVAAGAAAAAGRSAWGGASDALVGMGVARSPTLARLAALDALSAQACGGAERVRWLRSREAEEEVLGARPVSVLLGAGLRHAEYEELLRDGVINCAAVGRLGLVALRERLGERAAPLLRAASCPAPAATAATPPPRRSPPRRSPTHDSSPPRLSPPPAVPSWGSPLGRGISPPALRRSPPRERYALPSLSQVSNVM